MQTAMFCILASSVPAMAQLLPPRFHTTIPQIYKSTTFSLRRHLPTRKLATYTPVSQPRRLLPTHYCTSRHHTPLDHHSPVSNAGLTNATLLSRASFYTSTAVKMSDQDYEAFLNKANESSGNATTQEKKSYGTKSVDSEVPAVLKSVEEYYISDADEPFEPVALGFAGSSLSADDLKKKLGHNKEVEEIGLKEWDPKGQYKNVIEAVEKAVGGKGGVKIFRVELEGARTEYFVVGVKEGKVLGLKALSVES